jgi:hypothetical protein
MSKLGSFFASRSGRIPLSTLIAGGVGVVIIVVLAVLLATKGSTGSPAQGNTTQTSGAGTTAASTTASTAAGQQTTLAAQKSFDSPEAAIKFFVSSVAGNDFPAAEQTFAIDEYAAKFDFTGYATYLKTMMPLTMPAPAEYGMYVDMNKATALGDLTRQTKDFVYSFFEATGMDGSPIVVSATDDISQFVKAVDPSGLKPLQIAKIELPAPDVYNSATNVANFKRMAGFYGADEMAERVVTYSLGGQTFQGGFGLLRYGSDWKIFRLYSNLAAQPASGIVTKVGE